MRLVSLASLTLLVLAVPSLAQRRGGAAANPAPDWPVVFSGQLGNLDPALQQLKLCPGYYAGVPKTDPGRLQLQVGGTTTALWVPEPIGDRGAISLRAPGAGEGAAVALWLGGPGRGRSMDMGYCVLLVGPQIQLRRNGVIVQATDLPEASATGGHFLVGVRDGGRISVTLNSRRTVIRYEDPEPLTGPLYSRFGFGGQSVFLRDLEVRRPELSAEELAAIRDVPLLPEATQQPTPIAGTIFDADAKALKADWPQFQPKATAVRDDALVLFCSDGGPLQWCPGPYTGDIAFEVEFEYAPTRWPDPAQAKPDPADSYLANGSGENGFSIAISYGDALPEPAEMRNWIPGFAWDVRLPNSDGNIVLDAKRDGQENWVASCPSVTLVPGHRYTARVEKLGQRLRLFLDGIYICEATSPDVPGQDAPYFLGFGQWCSGNLVYSAKAYELGPATTEPQASARPVDAAGPAMQCSARELPEGPDDLSVYGLTGEVSDYEGPVAGYPVPEGSFLVAQRGNDWDAPEEPGEEGAGAPPTGLTDGDTPALAEQLRAVKGPVVLNLIGQGHVTAAGYAHLAGLTNIIAMTLRRNAGLDDAALASIAQLPGLRRLDLSECHKIGDAGVRQLAKLSRLRELSLARCEGVSPEAVGALSACPELVDLDLWEARGVSDATPLGQLSDLIVLRLSGDIAPASFPALARLTGLRVLSFSVAAEGSDLDFLSSLTKLENLDLEANTLLRDLAATPVPQLAALRSLNVRDCDNLEAGLASLKGLTQLETLDLYGCGSLSGEGFAALSGLPRLTSIDLSACTGLSEQGISELAQLRSLKQLHFWGCGLSDSSAKLLASLTSLEELDLSETEIGDATLGALAALPALRSVNLTGCRQVTDKGLAALLRCQALRDIRACGTGITTEGASAAMKQRDELNVTSNQE
jgi:hypothetical protein